MSYKLKTTINNFKSKLTDNFHQI